MTTNTNTNTNTLLRSVLLIGCKPANLQRGAFAALAVDASLEQRQALAALPVVARCPEFTAVLSALGSYHPATAFRRIVSISALSEGRPLLAI